LLLQLVDHALDVAAEKQRNVEAQRQPQGDNEALTLLRERLSRPEPDEATRRPRADRKDIGVTLCYGAPERKTP
jgi:hypothetical protein